MSQNIGDFVPSACDLLALGEPTHQEPAFGWLRNELFGPLAGHGFRSIAIESDRVAAFAVNDFVQEGAGTLESAMTEGFSHSLGELDTNRQLVAWMRKYNEGRPAEERLAFHGFDAATEMMSAPSPRRYLEHARDYLGLDLDIYAGDDESWSRTEAVMDPAMSVGATPEADALRAIADDMLTEFYRRAPQLIAATSRAEWFRAKTFLTTGRGLLRYHKQCAEFVDRDTRYSRLIGIRDALMAENLLEIRDLEAGRGPTLVVAHNQHLQRNPSNWHSPVAEFNWNSAGAIVSSLVGERYAVVAGSLGRSETIGLGEPEPDTYEGLLQKQITGWGLVDATAIAPARKRTDTKPEQGYFPLDQEAIGGVDTILHIAVCPRD
jgi:erythromycin esterase-like protein